MKSLPAILPDNLNTYAGIITFAAPFVASIFGYAPTPSFDADLPEAITAVAMLLGSAYALYGKLRHQIPHWFTR